MKTQGKVWGSTSLLFARSGVEVHLITGTKGMRCSNHKHSTKFNAFYVLRGSIKICIEKNAYNLTDKTVLVAGQTTEVEPQEYHWFEILEEDTLALEFYWTELNPGDIERKDVGGPATTSPLISPVDPDVPGNPP